MAWTQGTEDITKHLHKRHPEKRTLSADGQTRWITVDSTGRGAYLGSLVGAGAALVGDSEAEALETSLGRLVRQVEGSRSTLVAVGPGDLWLKLFPRLPFILPPAIDRRPFFPRALHGLKA